MYIIYSNRSHIYIYTYIYTVYVHIPDQTPAQHLRLVVLISNQTRGSTVADPWMY